MGHSNYTYLKLNEKSALQNKHCRRSSVNFFLRLINIHQKKGGREGGVTEEKRGMGGARDRGGIETEDKKRGRVRRKKM